MYHGKSEIKNREREREKINNLEGIVQSYVKAKKEMKKKKS